VQKKNLNPTWAPILISFQKLCNGDIDRPLKLECIDWDSDGSHDAIGNLTISWRALQEAAGKEPITLIHPRKNVPAGKLYVMQASLEEQPSFLQYIQQGCELNFMVAIDFTASNGHPADPNSLHYMNPAVPSKYQQAIQAIGEVLEFYDSDMNFPAYGFGGKYSNEPVQHCFALNGQGFNPEVHGTAGIIQAYHQALSVMTLHGPTLFAPVINAAVAQAAVMHTNIRTQQRYLVLTILCDGMILDMEATVDAIVKASSLPLSIFIVGIGAADFSNMRVLDGDDAILTTRTGHRAARDIVQFVEIGARTGNDVKQITAELLEELPGQFTKYMKMNDSQFRDHGFNLLSWGCVIFAAALAWDQQQKKKKKKKKKKEKAASADQGDAGGTTFTAASVDTGDRQDTLRETCPGHSLAARQDRGLPESDAWRHNAAHFRPD
ncbi:hypothetical protein CYMTET_52980, partial [Cymbomonas tetramitiformis]